MPSIRVNGSSLDHLSHFANEKACPYNGPAPSHVRDNGPLSSTAPNLSTNSIMDHRIYPEFFSILSISPCFVGPQRTLLSIDDMKAFNNVSISTIFASFIWIALRVVPEPNPEDAKEAWISGFEKEFSASQTLYSDSQLFDYDELFDMDPEYPIAPSWRHRARTVASSLAARFRRLPMLFPKVNRTKSVSRETAEMYLQYQAGNVKRGPPL